MSNSDKELKDLENLIWLQGEDGNWNWNSYMLGLYNGLELARSIVANDDPSFKSKPVMWIETRGIIRTKLKNFRTWIRNTYLKTL